MISGLRGKGIQSWILAPFKLLLALLQSLAILMRVRPMAVLGMGGFVSGPGGVMTWLLRKPLLIHEQNAIAGMTNRLLSRVATKTLLAFPDALPLHKNTYVTGNPVRAAIAAVIAPEQRLSSHSGAMRLLVLGGSLGARALNEVVPQAIALMSPEVRPEIWHQAGELHAEATQGHYQQAGVNAKVAPFIDDMAEAYAWADLVLCRAGALTVAELAAVGIGAILVPYPYAVDDHQTHNAAYLADCDAAVVVPQSQLSPDRLSHLLIDLCAGNDEAGNIARQRLLMMAKAARQMAKPDAATTIANLCVEVCHG
jgi:UDP-N-acetylglucosamine--N-acetylmuramyl-(pentapeptide) pyrophosphoryl-undecaprenol N-acetylglucosamine transferase